MFILKMIKYNKNMAKAKIVLALVLISRYSARVSLTWGTSVNKSERTPQRCDNLRKPKGLLEASETLFYV